MRILVFGITDNPGGVESVIMNYLRHIDREKYRFDFLCNTEKVAYREEIQSLGCDIYQIPARSRGVRQYKEAMTSFFLEHANSYDAIWVNVCSLANIDYLIYAKKYGIPKRIIHSHNSQNMDSKLRGLLHKVNKNLIERYATDFWACSKEAAEWFYKPSLMKRVKYIRNAIDADAYCFDEPARQKIRSLYHLENCYVAGNIGRLHFQKNQMFLLDVFKELHRKDNNTKLVLVGNGPDLEKLQEKVSGYALQDSVIFAGVQNNIAEWLSAMDIFVFPSLFEGLGLAGLEAQANGIPSLVSDCIPEEMAINSNWITCSLDSSAEQWADRILEIRSSIPRLDSQTAAANIKNSGFDILQETEKLEDLLEELPE